MNFSKRFLSLISNKENNKVKSIIENCRLHHVADANHRHPGATLLHHAVVRDNLEITKYLLEKGCDFDARDAYGNTALILAAALNCADILELLLAAGADVSIEKYDGEDALSLALSKGWFEKSTLLALFAALGQKYSSEEIARRLVALSCPLDVAVLARDAKVVEYLIERDVSVEGSDPAYETPLHVAVGLSDVETVRVLLKYNAEVEAPNDINGATPLHCLDYDDSERDGERLEILKILLSKEVSLTSCTEDGSFQVEPTLVRGSSEAVRLVLQSWIDFGAENERGATLLHCLAMNTNRGVVGELKKYVAMLDVDAPDWSGHKPLTWAVSRGNVDMVQFLMDQGAEAVPEALFEVFGGESDSDLEASRDQCVEILLQCGADPEATFVSSDCRKILQGVESQGLDRIKLAVARLAISEKQGVGITESIGSAIHSHRTLGSYMEKCRRLLGKQLFGSVFIFELLTADEKKTTKYLSNSELALKLVRIGHKQKLKSIY